MVKFFGIPPAVASRVSSSAVGQGLEVDIVVLHLLPCLVGVCMGSDRPVIPVNRVVLVAVTPDATDYAASVID